MRSNNLQLYDWKTGASKLWSVVEGGKRNMNSVENVQLESIRSYGTWRNRLWEEYGRKYS